MSELKISGYDHHQYDVIVVGAGSAGCAAAYRLAESSNKKILLLEAGSPARNPLLHIPLGFAFLLKPHKNNWNYVTLPERQLNNRRINLPRGKVMGGCSAINGMVYIRGQAEDYDRWQSLGNEGWSYKECLPYFKRSENNENGCNDYHGASGPLWVGNVCNEFTITDDFIKACEQSGHPFNTDVNGETQEGVSFYPTNIKKGKRWSSATAFLGAGKKLNNLTVLPFAHAKRVLFEGKRVKGVECIIKGKPVTYLANKVVLCAGAINSPKILEMSGIGQNELLSKHGIRLVKELPGVGENLHDHWNAYLKCSIKDGKTYYSEAKILPMLKNLLRYVFTGRGFLANPGAMVAVFYKAADGAKTADSQMHFAPAASELDAKGNMIPIDGITISTCGVRPSSRGYCHIAANDIDTPPLIQVNYLDTEYDQQIAVSAFKKARDIFQTDAAKKLAGTELEPGRSISSDEQILAYIRDTGQPVHHLAGTCKMGRDEMAVVDNQLQVHGVQGLYVADASVMPEIISGNTHAACVMLGERVADFVLASES